MLLFFSYLILKISCLQTPSGILINNLSTVIYEFVQKSINISVPEVAIMILKDGIPQFSESYGYSNLENKTSGKLNDIFEWGSITKTITFASIMQLYEDGSINLTEDIRKYLGNDFFKKLRFEEPITILNLMNHNAGWDELRSGTGHFDRNRILSLDEIQEENEPFQFAKPGDFTAYSNYGVMIAGLIVEKIKKMKFHEYVKINIFDKLGMIETTMDPSLKNYSIQKNVIGYNLGEKNNLIKYEHQNAAIMVYPAGACIGPITDLAKFLDAITPTSINSTKLMNSTTLKLFLTISNQFSTSSPANSHGFWSIPYQDNNYSIEHAGATYSFTSYFGLMPDNGWGIIVLTNVGKHGFLTRGLKNIIFGFPNTTNYIPLKKAEKTQGSYINQRRSHRGVTSLLETIGSIIEIQYFNESIIIFDGIKYKEIAPNTYRIFEENISASSNILFFEIKDEKIIKIITGPVDYIPFNNLKKIELYTSIFLLIINLIWSLISLIDIITHLFKNFLNIIRIINFFSFLIILFYLLSNIKFLSGFAQGSLLRIYISLLSISMIFLLITIIILIIKSIKIVNKEKILELPLNDFENKKKSEFKIVEETNIQTFYRIYSIINSIILLIISIIWEFYL